MNRNKPRTPVGTAPPGTWLAFLAVAVQVLLPFLVAYEIALVGTPAYAGTTASICSDSGMTQAPRTQSGDAEHHHGLADGCPICTALAAAQAFTMPSPSVTPPPREAHAILQRPNRESRPSVPVAASYHPRAPPFIA